ncbi:MAG: hypothetical protein ACRBEE_06440 [Arenicella sp.]
MSEKILLSKRISQSPYLSRIASFAESEQHFVSVELLASEQGYARALESIIASVSDYPSLDIVETNQCQKFLVDMKNHFSLLWSHAQLSQSVSFAERGRLQSLFADATIHLALKAAWFSNDLKQVRKHLPAEACTVPGLFVLGLGKLGGMDLNFSSDVDLVAYYDAQTLPVPSAIGQGYIVNKVLQKMTKILRNDDKTDFVWRVDWRLRPEASSSLLSMNVETGKDFYFFRALPWHRLALMKARVVGGDIDLGQHFLNEMRPFVWRQNLDFRAVDELAHIKKRINLEHPGLKHQRTWEDPITKECAGFNVKLGSGGIREIEFIINGLQLLWGGKHIRLRQTNTLLALSQLLELGHIEEVDALVLEESYQFFRELENLIQMLNNAQTHLMPTELLLQEQLIGMRSVNKISNVNVAWDDLSVEIMKHRLRVNTLFNEFFANEDESEVDDFEFPENWESTLDARSNAIVENWTNGFTQYGVSSGMAVALEPLSNKLLSAVYHSQTKQDLNVSFVRVDDFLGSLSSPDQYFRLLASHPDLADSIVPPLLHSPHMGKLLKQSPHIIDHLLEPKGSMDLVSRVQGFESQLSSIFASDDYGIRLESLRRYVNENLYESYLAFFRGDMPVKNFQMCLTRLAECTLAASLEIAKQELQLTSLPLVVLGMGKLAMSRMSPLSDLDLVFIFDDDFELEVAQKVVSRLQTILGMELREGIAYELDTRLRPSGRSGPPTVFLSGFREHHMERAKNWEHIALLPSRIVAGDIKLGHAVMQIKHDIFVKSRDDSQWLTDVKKMWRRVEEQRIQDVDADIVSSKLRKGGLMQAEYLAVCFCIDQLSDPEFYQANKHQIDRFSYLLQNTQKAHDIEIDLNQAIEFWSTVQIWERLLGLENGSYDDMPEHLQRLMLQQLDCDSMKSFYIKAEKVSQRVEHAMNIYFSSCPVKANELEEWQELRVQWQ